jgi:hypothetical protein
MNNDSLKIALVDGTDKIIGFAAKDEVHKKGLLHRAFRFLYLTQRISCFYKKELSQNIILEAYSQIHVVRILLRV